jgi:DNA-binding transcriptional ArsR family regulator
MAYQSSALLVFSDPTRLAIVERLVEGPLAVVDLAREFPISRPAVSQHLRILKDAGLVFDTRVGNRRVYRVDPAALAALRDQLDQFWAKALASYKTIAEQEERDKKE